MYARLGRDGGSFIDAFVLVRRIRKIQVFSPTPANREAYAAEMRQKHGLEVVVCDNPRDAYRGADIVAAAPTRPCR